MLRAIILVLFNLARAKVQYLECDEIREFVKAHNIVRKYLAEGHFHDKTPAAHMSGIVWDDELQQKAEEWAGKGLVQSNPNKTIPSGRFTVGENIYFYTSWSRPNIDPREAVEYWVKQHDYYEYKRHVNRDAKTDSYTQMIWENSIYLGCGIDRRAQNAKMYFLVVCYYGPEGNVVGSFPYKKAKEGKRSIKLYCGAKDCSKRYGGVCSN